MKRLCRGYPWVRVSTPVRKVVALKLLPAVRYPELDRPARFAIWSNFLAMVGCTVQERIPSGINVETDASDEESVMIVTSQAIRTRQDVAREVVHQAGTEEGFTKQPGSYITTKDVALLAEKPFNGMLSYFSMRL